MNRKLITTFCFMLSLGIVVPAIAEAANYADICRSTRLAASDRKECRQRMKEAKSDTERAQIFREYDLKMSGLGLDGKPLKDK